jgi:hypothetical protein
VLSSSPSPMHPVVRVLAVAVIAAAALTCADHSVSGVRLGGLAQLAIAPVFDQAPAGGPDIDIVKVRGTLTKLTGTDSVVAEALVAGDSAILEFNNVTVTGDSTAYTLDVKAFDKDNIQVFDGHQDLKIKPGDNKPAAPQLNYSAPDMSVASLAITPKPLALDWAGAAPNDVTCLNRVPSQTAKTEQKLTLTGKNASNQDVSGVRAGWTSRNESVVTVDADGLVKARCSNSSTYVVARTFLNVADSVQVTVTAPPFTLLMSPDSTSLARGASVQLTALVVDENNNSVPASQVTWGTSDATRATVSSTGLVQGIRNGRVIITANSGNRSTIGIVQVVRPTAASVVVLPAKDTLAVGMVRGYFAKALDALNRVIGDATEFQWSTSDASKATVSSTGVTTAQAVGNANISAAIDGKSGSLALNVAASLPPGAIKSIVKNGATDAPISGASVTSGANTATTLTDGSFTLNGLKAGDDVTITASSGFIPVTLFNVPVYPNQTLQIPAVPMAPQSTSPAIMTSKVVNALTGSGVSGATVKAYPGLNGGPSPSRPTVQPSFTATTGSDGVFSFTSVPAGIYTFVVSQTGYSEMQSIGIAIGGATKQSPVILLPPVTPPGALVIVLTWGDCTQPNVPCDLDAHLTGPKTATDTTRFQVFHASRSYVVDTDTIAALDVDASNGRGPEVIGLRPSAAPGTYRFYVHNFTNATVTSSRALSDSAGARVDVFLDSHVIGTFFPPPGQVGTLWKVFEFDGARLFPTGQISFQTDASVLAMRAGAPDPAADDAQRVLDEARRHRKNRR